jgi:ribosomal protein S18 acetylase RimI-like enzyme
MQIRHYAQTDEPSFVALFQEFEEALAPFKPTDRWRVQPGLGAVTARAAHDEVARKEGAIFVAEESGELVGFVVGVIDRPTESSSLAGLPTSFGWINNLYVRDDERGRGIGRALMATIEGHFRARGCDIARLRVHAANVRAARVYEELGYGDWGRDLWKALS